MFLSQLTLQNFRCYQQAEFTSLGRLAVFIGENDAGKTVFLDAVELVSGRRTAVPRDFHRLQGGDVENEFSLEAVFNLDEKDTLPEQWRSGGSLHLRRVYKLDTGVLSEASVLGQGYSDTEFDAFTSLQSDPQKQLLKKYHKIPASNPSGRLGQRDELVAEGALTFVERWVKLSLSETNTLNTYLPITERISSTEYRHPEQVIQRRLQSVASSVIRPTDPETGENKEIDALLDVRALIEEALNEEIQTIVPVLQRVHRKLEGVIAKPNIDFAKAVTTSNIILDCGAGEQSFEAFGEGTKKRIWMGLLEWESGGAGANSDGRNIIRLYDEPDVNLHYGAQRQLFQNILEIADDAAMRTQCFVCTHSVQLIDRAPITAVNLIKVEDDNSRTPCRIHGLDEGDYTDFYRDVGSAVGLTNTALLYERAFLIVEGESEEAAIPIIYQNIFGRDMRDDGLKIIDLTTCGAWKSILKVLLRNRAEMLHLLLDQDCVSGSSGASDALVNEDELKKLGIPVPPGFETEQVTYIGTKEFEDAFDSNVIYTAIMAHYEPAEGSSWLIEEIEHLKTTSPKFSEALMKHVARTCAKSQRSMARKPFIAAAVARHCLNESDVPPLLLQTLHKLRARAGIV